MKVAKFLIILVLNISTMVAFSQGCITKQDSATNRTIFIATDKPPVFNGGFDSLRSIIRKNLKWPGQCCLEGSVYVSFVIEVDGKVTNKQIRKGISNQKHCDADGEALNVVDYLNQWTPGECQGVKVPTEMTLPITFTLSNTPK
jgi:periplasmic protein TonB